VTTASDLRWRLSAHARVAVFVFIVIALCIAIPGSVLELRNDLRRPIERVYGQVEHLHAIRRTGRGSTPNVSLKLNTDPRWLAWNCWALGCRPYEDIFKLHDAPWPMAEAYRIGDHLVGLSIDGRTYLSPQRERTRLLRGEVGEIALFGAIALVMALVGRVWLLKGANRYRPPDPAGALRIKSKMAGLGVTRTRSRP
jgi:hypothetical protein